MIPDYPTIAKSELWFKRSQGLIPCNTQTLAKGPTQYIDGVAPKYLERGKGCHVWDVDGNEYLDYNMGIGPISLGYCYPEVDRAIFDQLAKGITFSMMHPLEVEVAELIHQLIPNAESVRFSKSGADVTSAAIRIARAYTGRSKVLCCGYHGWHDWYVCTIGRNAGIPQEVRELTYTFAYNDIESLKRSLDRDVAAVILEPVVFEEPQNDFLHHVADLCRENGSLLIFDEMWTGFRMALGGAQEYFSIKADMATFSKAVANGMPLSILTGKKEILQVLDDQVFFFTTFGGEALSLAAAKATITEMKTKQVIQSIQLLGSRLKNGYNELANSLGLSFTRAVGYDFRSMVTFDTSAGDPLILKSFVQQELFKRGILWSGTHNVSYSHTAEDIQNTLDSYKEVLILLRSALESGSIESKLMGKPIQPTFRKVTDFNTKPKF